jgi:hypothetical protein
MFIIWIWPTPISSPTARQLFPTSQWFNHLSHFKGVYVLSREKWAVRYMCARDIDLPLSTIFRLDFGTISTVLYFLLFFFHFILSQCYKYIWKYKNRVNINFTQPPGKMYVWCTALMVPDIVGWWCLIWSHF